MFNHLREHMNGFGLDFDSDIDVQIKSVRHRYGYRNEQRGPGNKLENNDTLERGSNEAARVSTTTTELAVRGQREGNDCWVAHDTIGVSTTTSMLPNGAHTPAGADLAHTVPNLHSRHPSLHRSPRPSSHNLPRQKKKPGTRLTKDGAGDQDIFEVGGREWELELNATYYPNFEEPPSATRSQRSDTASCEKQQKEGRDAAGGFGMDQNSSRGFRTLECKWDEAVKPESSEAADI
ncbi:hypothetical protein B0H14DRAFT_2564573 [Mycena olivaceomarginata]|nr:hypothetical protein B0H14DRAFT_2564573 [Mycena olivaceomarginata]